MRQVIFIDSEQNSEKPVEFTDYLDSMAGWRKAALGPSHQSKIVYLGKCQIDGDMFAGYSLDGCITIYKGHLNSGKY